MNDRQRLEAIVAVVCRYLPPDGISRKEAMSQIISLVDPLPEQSEGEKMNTQPEALVLADAIEKGNYFHEDVMYAATELRRLHEVNQELVEALELMIEDARHDRVNVGVFNKAVDALTKARGTE